jgi:hypothetical protein
LLKVSNALNLRYARQNLHVLIRSGSYSSGQPFILACPSDEYCCVLLMSTDRLYSTGAAGGFHNNIIRVVPIWTFGRPLLEKALPGLKLEIRGPCSAPVEAGSGYGNEGEPFLRETWLDSANVVFSDASVRTGERLDGGGRHGMARLTSAGGNLLPYGYISIWGASLQDVQGMGTEKGSRTSRKGRQETDQIGGSGLIPQMGVGRGTTEENRAKQACT